MYYRNDLKSAKLPYNHLQPTTFLLIYYLLSISYKDIVSKIVGL